MSTKLCDSNSATMTAAIGCPVEKTAKEVALFYLDSLAAASLPTSGETACSVQHDFTAAPDHQLTSN